MGEKFKVYAAFEVGIWLPGLFALCYCYQPSVRFVCTRVGGAVVQSIGAWLRRYVPSQYEKIAALSQRAYGSPKGRTTAEWLLLNKVLSPVSLPSKLFLANCARLRVEPKSSLRPVCSALTHVCRPAAQGSWTGRASRRRRRLGACKQRRDDVSLVWRRRSRE